MTELLAFIVGLLVGRHCLRSRSRHQHQLQRQPQLNYYTYLIESQARRNREEAYWSYLGRRGL